MIGDKHGFIQALSSGMPIMMDGAMGTEIDRRGTRIAGDDWLLANLGLPETVSEIHTAYAKAGARIHIANSFAAGRHVLEQVGLGPRFEKLNRDAVRVCRAGIRDYLAGDAWIAGSISTYMVGSDRSLLPPADELRVNARDQAYILAEEGCALIVLEMLFDADVTMALFEGAAETGLPTSLGFTCSLDHEGHSVTRAMDGSQRSFATVLEDVLSRLPKHPGTVLTAMHGLPDATTEALAEIKRHWTGPTAVYPNAGRHNKGVGWEHSDVPTPADFAAQCRGWHDAGANILGGCCGLGPDHIAAMVDEFR